MGHQRSRSLTALGVVGIAALVAAGCGGGEEPIPADAGAVPAPIDGTGGVTGLEGQDLDGDGIPDAQAQSADLGATASIPDLSGGDVGGGLSSPSGNAPVFEATAVDGDELAAETKDEETITPVETGPIEDTKPEAPSFSSAKIYVDGIIHDVEQGDAFPSDNPVFRLLTINSGNIEIELIAGEFTSGGGSGVLIDKGELVSLVNASEQLTYRVKFMRAVKGDSGITF